VREEVYRREHETARTMQQTAQARQIAGAIQQLHHEFSPALAAEGVDVLTATRNLMQISSQLQFGNQQQKAGLVAQIMRAYGVDIPTLDAILSNTQMPTQQQAQQEAFRDPRVDGLLSQLAAVRQREDQQVRKSATDEVEAFGAKHDFFNDVREVMADLIELFDRRGVDLSFEQAYERACQMDPEISRVLAQRAAAGAAQNQQRSTVRNKAAASSVRSTPAVGAPGAAPENLRGTIEAAWDAAASG
jgi:hypothetical protein